MFTNKTYDILKEIPLVLEALGTLYFALSGIWGLPYGEAVVGTITAVVTCLTAILRISKYNYDKRENEDDEGGAEG